MDLTKKKVAALTGVISVAVLTACSGNNVEGPNADANSDVEKTAEQTAVSGTPVFDFTHPQLTEAEVGPAEEIRLVIDDELLAIAGDYDSDYAQNRTLEAITVSAGEHPDSQCSVQISYELAEDSKANEPRYVALAPDYHPDRDYDYQDLEVVETARFPVEPGGADLDWELRELPTLYEETERTVPVGCASSPGAGETVQVSFPVLRQTPGFNIDDPENGWGFQSHTVEDFAVADIWVMASGDVGIANWEVDGFSWAANEQTKEAYGWLPDGYSIDSQGNIIEG